jgi:hypothetical protein
MVVLHSYNTVHLDLLWSSDRIQTDFIRLAIENYIRTSIQALESDLPLWRNHTICEIHCNAAVVSVICSFMDYDCCNIFYWSTYCTSTVFVQYCTAQYITILLYYCTTVYFDKNTQYKGEWYNSYHLQVQYWSLYLV